MAADASIRIPMHVKGPLMSGFLIMDSATRCTTAPYGMEWSNDMAGYGHLFGHILAAADVRPTRFTRGT